MEVVTALVVYGSCEAECAALLVDAEQISRVYQQHVGQTLLLEGDGLDHSNSDQNITNKKSPKEKKLDTKSNGLFILVVYSSTGCPLFFP